MATLKFTKETIEVVAENIKYYADELLDALKDNDLDFVDTYAQKIARCCENITFRLKDCEEY